MDYYLLPLEKNEVDQFEDMLKEINYDVDDRASVWSEESIEEIVTKMTEENAHQMIDFLPVPVADKFTMLFKAKLNNDQI